MRIVYLSNFFNHHQKPLADELYEATGHNYWFVETKAMPRSTIELGYTEYKRPYIISYSESNRNYIQGLIREADVVICGEAPSSMIKERVGEGKLTFRDDERRYKSLIKYLKWPLYTLDSMVFNKGYLLSASAYGARDYVLSGMNRSRCFKWGYFTELKLYDNIDSLIEKKSSLDKKSKVSLLWACRLIGWKHPELAVELARLLKRDGYYFELRIAGKGPLESSLNEMIIRKDLKDCVKIIGPQKQEHLRTLMEESDIFLATSDQNEGWGATINESMNSACAVVASHSIGSVPFLIKDGENGLVFRSKDIHSFYEKVKWLFDHPQERQQLGRKAYLTVKEVWNARSACKNLLSLVDALQKGEGTPIKEGPCSKAEILNHKWM